DAAKTTKVLETQISGLTTAKAKLESSLALKGADNAKLMQEITVKDETIKGMKNELSDKDKILEKLTKKIKQNETDLAIALKNNLDQQSEIALMKTDLNNLTQHQEEASKTVKALESEITGLTTAKTKLESSLAAKGEDSAKLVEDLRT
ncbi:MAG: hypothetical protein HQL29_02380, partial [Candidatus Omnitrophica bacterium]|nr:hypothetical protein [Candidatus Omnitrophota bacterium]